MKLLRDRLFGGQLQTVLIACFALVAIVTVGLNTAVTLRVITDYLDDAMSRRVARDMDLANAFYQIKLDEIAAVSERIGRDPLVAQNLGAAIAGDQQAQAIIDQQISRKVTVPTLGGTHVLVILDADGNITAGRTLTESGRLSPPIRQGSWKMLPIVDQALTSGTKQAATEVIPVDYLAEVALDEKASIPLVDTPKAAPALYDAREGTAGLALTSVFPVRGEGGDVLGAVAAAHLFNNDFSLVDRVQAVAGVDTATVFFGDLRVSTNVKTEQGERAVGTRLSQDVYEVVLNQGQNYVGRAFVVNDWFITRYEPLRNNLGQVVGSLYVGARESTFQALVNNFASRVGLIALASLILAAIIAVPIARLITRPISTLVEANRRLSQGDMDVRVEPYGRGELAELGDSFNRLAETLDSTQQELLHKERLASMGQLAAGVAHEINNPLGTILLFSDILYKETAENDPRREDLKLIVNETIRCKNIVADLLNFARQQEVLAQETDLNALISAIVETTQLLPKFEQVSFECDLAPNLPVIQADPAQLEQVFTNLINNATEAMPDGGTIQFVTRALGNDCVEITVADKGYGIPAENLGKLFTPFFTTKAVGKGTGLGLSIVYGIIKMHKGQVTVKSEEGRGSVFTITLPVNTKQEYSALVGETIGAAV